MTADPPSVQITTTWTTTDVPGQRQALLALLLAGEPEPDRGEQQDQPAA